MKTLAMTLTLLAGLPLAASAQVTKEDLKKLATAGISDDVIVSYVKANGPIAKLSADDVVELKQAGVSEKVLSVVLGAPWTAPVKERVVEKQVVSAPPTTTYVYDSTPYYYTPTAYYYSDYYYPRYSYASYYPSYYYPRSYYSSYCYPRYSVCSPSISFGFSIGRYCSSRGYFGVSAYRR
ncbi:MAG: hypothetical protein HY293_12035 [Planctomycetes bacterium]|nr:hypothetical protein [Planctomycetota bacterium]